MRFECEVDDAIAAEFVDALNGHGYDFKSLIAKEVSDFVNAKRQKDAEASIPPITKVEQLDAVVGLRAEVEAKAVKDAEVIEEIAVIK